MEVEGAEVSERMASSAVGEAANKRPERMDSIRRPGPRQRPCRRQRWRGRKMGKRTQWELTTLCRGAER